MKIKDIDIIICLLYYAVFKIEIMPFVPWMVTKTMAIAIVLFFLVANLKIKKLFNISIPFVITICISSVYSYTHGLNTFGSALNGVLYGVVFYCIATLLIYCREKNHIDRFINCFYKMTFVYVILTIISIIINRPPSSEVDALYFVGNKFSASYLFIFFTVLFGMRYIDLRKNGKMFQMVYYLLAITTVFVSWYIHCTTSMVSSLVLFVLPVIPKLMRKVVCSIKGVLIALALSAIVIFMIEVILMDEHIRFVIVNTLKETLSLSGRLQIYKILPKIVSGSSWFGYGYGNNIIEQSLGYGNAQNGVLEIIVNYGIVGSVILLWTIYKCIHAQIGENYWRIYALTYAMIVASIVEVSIGYEFFLSIFIIYAASKKIESSESVEHKRLRIKKIKIKMRN